MHSLILTRGILSDSGSVWEITAPSNLAFPLVIAIYCIIAVVFYRVWLITRSILKNWSTISSSTTSIINVTLKNRITQSIITYAISSICKKIERPKNQKISHYWAQPNILLLLNFWRNIIQLKSPFIGLVRMMKNP